MLFFSPSERIASIADASIFMIGFVSFYGLLNRISHFLLSKTQMYSKLTKTNQVDFNSRVVSTIHAVLSMVWSSLLLLHPHFQVPKHHVTTINKDIYLCIIHSFSYLLYDIIDVTIHFKYLAEVGTYLHHCGFILLTLVSLHYQVGPFFLVIYLVTEVTTPFVNIRFFLAVNDYKGFWYVVNGVLLWFLWLIFRVIGACSISIWTLRENHELLFEQGITVPTLSLWAGFVLITSLNFGWFILISKAIVKAAYRALSHNKSNKIKEA